MSKNELNEIFNNIQFQMICEQNSGYRNEYSKNLQQKMNLYNYIIELKQALNEIKDIVLDLKYGNFFTEIQNFKDTELGKAILQIIDKVGGNE